MMRFNVMFSSCVIIYALCFLLVCSPSWAVEGQCLDEQRHLLLHLKHNLSFSSSSSESGVPVGLSSWDLNTDCCRSWEGVECNQIGEVIGLDLSNKSIVGSTDGLASLFQLSHLQGLNLGYNHFNSAIPSGFDRLPNLTHLNLSTSGFVGQIPIGISRLARLVSLDLSCFGYCYLKLESSNLRMLVGNLSELRELSLVGVNISSDKERNEWAQIFSSSLPKLQVLNLEGCSLSGPFHSSLSKLHSLSQLWLTQNNFSTEIPEFFGSFSNLTVLHLFGCGLKGKFPKSVFILPKLEQLVLSYNPLLEGSLPEFPQDNSFQVLSVSGTSFSGEVPTSIGNLKYLSTLDLSGGRFNGSVPSSVFALPSLKLLRLSYNQFSGHLDIGSPNNKLGGPNSVSIFNISSLEWVDLSYNQFNCTLELNRFEGFPNLSTLILSGNNLSIDTNTINPALFPQLQTLMLGSCNLGVFPDFLRNQSRLTYLDLSNNGIGGNLSSWIESFTQLEELILSSNQFNGTLELNRFEALTNLVALGLSENNLLSIDTNTINPALFPQLRTLTLGSCNLGVFPDFLRNQSRLTGLDLSNNSISGNLPSWIENIGNGSLRSLNLSHNSLENPERPFSNSSFKELFTLDLHANLFQGPIPILPPSADYLDYSHNNLCDSIPNNIGSFLSGTRFFSLANNNIHGQLPKSLCDANAIEVVDLSSNSLSGSILSCTQGIGRKLRVLNLRRNHFSGIVNAIFREDCALRTINLNGNRLEGHVPTNLSNCKTLEVLDLGNNQFNGTFPHWLGNLATLRVLVLHSNHFQGSIGLPKPNYTFPVLQIMDISSNGFSGMLPSEWFKSWELMRNDRDENGSRSLGWHIDRSNYRDEVTVTMKGLELELVKILTIFTSVDLSNNAFVGTIPKEIGDLRALYILNLSRNAFTGQIPSSIGNLKRLESFDLSQNQLTGTIPSELTGLTSLEVMNLSFNNLEGKIPKGPQFETFEENSYRGNNGLCGPPLSKICTAVIDQHTPGNGADDDNEDGLCKALKFLFKDCADNKSEFKWQLVVAALGFGIGNGIACWLVLVFYGSRPKRKRRSTRRNRRL